MILSRRDGGRVLHRIAYRVYWITREDVLRATKDAEPEPAHRHRWCFVTIHGERFPVKQVVRLTVGDDLPRGFHTRHARRILTRLDFDF